jgi:hypothetical protein
MLMVFCSYVGTSSASQPVLPLSPVHYSALVLSALPHSLVLQMLLCSSPLSPSTAAQCASIPPIAHEFSSLFVLILFQSDMIAMWGIDALLADEAVSLMSAAAASADSGSDSSSLIQWLESMLGHAAPVAMCWSKAFAAATHSAVSVVNSMTALIVEVASLLPTENLDLSDSDHAGLFHVLARAQELLCIPAERPLLAVFDGATTRCFQELSRNLQVVVQRCVQTDDFSSTAAPSVKHSSSAVDVGIVCHRICRPLSLSLINFGLFSILSRFVQLCPVLLRLGSDLASPSPTRQLGNVGEWLRIF